MRKPALSPDRLIRSECSQSQKLRITEEFQRGVAFHSNNSRYNNNFCTVLVVEVLPMWASQSLHSAVKISEILSPGWTRVRMGYQEKPRLLTKHSI